jgi:hypothetical protein
VPRKPLIDKTSASYLDKLGRKSALAYAPVVLRQVEEARSRGDHVALPLTDADLQQLLDNTISALNREGNLSWSNTPGTRQGVFIMAWYEGMQSRGLA